MRSRFTSAHAISLVALFIAIGGTAWAAATINSGDVINDSLKSKDLKDGKGVKGADVVDASLGTADLGDNSITSAKVDAGAIGTSDLADNAVTSAKILDGTVSTDDILDATVGTGDLADNAVNSAKVVDDSVTGGDIDESTLGTVPVARNLSSITVERVDFDVANGLDNGATATCPTGTQAIAGGVRNDNADSDGYVEISRPVLTGTEGPVQGGTFDGWRAFVFNQTDAQSGQTFGANTLQSTVWAVCVG
jgi:hypothetical protein